VNRLELAFTIGGSQFALGDIRGEFDDLEWFAATIQQRVIGSLNPDRPPALGDALELLSPIFAAPERSPEFTVFVAVAALRLDKHAVMLAADFLERVSHGGEKVRVRGDDRPIEMELDHSLRPVQRVELGLCVAGCPRKPHMIAPQCPAMTYTNSS
jgi:hypothetical protein